MNGICRTYVEEMDGILDDLDHLSNGGKRRPIGLLAVQKALEDRCKQALAINGRREKDRDPELERHGETRGTEGQEGRRRRKASATTCENLSGRRQGAPSGDYHIQLFQRTHPNSARSLINSKSTTPESTKSESRRLLAAL